MARTVGDRRIRPPPPQSGIRYLRRRVPTAAALSGGVRRRLPRRPDRAEPQDHGVVPGATRPPSAGRTVSSSAPSSTTAPCATSAGWIPRSTPMASGRAGPTRRSPDGEHRARGPGPIFVIPVVAVAMVLRSVERQRADKRRPHRADPGVAGREQADDAVLLRTIRPSARRWRPRTRNTFELRARPITTRTSPTNCSVASMPSWTGAAASDCSRMYPGPAGRLSGNCRRPTPPVLEHDLTQRDAPDWGWNWPIG